MNKKIDRAEVAWPIIGEKDHSAPSVFRPQALSREARRQRQLPLVAVPEVSSHLDCRGIVRRAGRCGLAKAVGWFGVP